MQQRTRTGETISGDVPGSAAAPSEQGAAIAGSSYRAGHRGPGPRVMGAATLNGDEVLNRQGEKLGTIEEIMLDVPTGRIAYAVLSCGGFLGIGDKLFAIPWSSLTLDPENHCFVLDVAKERLVQAPGFDKERWPSMVDENWARELHTYYRARPYWE